MKTLKELLDKIVSSASKLPWIDNAEWFQASIGGHALRINEEGIPGSLGCRYRLQLLPCGKDVGDETHGFGDTSPEGLIFHEARRVARNFNAVMAELDRELTALEAAEP